jgi:hypothetical protein
MFVDDLMSSSLLIGRHQCGSLCINHVLSCFHHVNVKHLSKHFDFGFKLTYLSYDIVESKRRIY